MKGIDRRKWRQAYFNKAEPEFSLGTRLSRILSGQPRSIGKLRNVAALKADLCIAPHLHNVGLKFIKIRSDNGNR